MKDRLNIFGALLFGTLFFGAIMLFAGLEQTLAQVPGPPDPPNSQPNQQPPVVSDDNLPTGDFSLATKEELERGKHNLTQAFDGWIPEYGGYRRTPIILEPDDDGNRKRTYPMFGVFGFGQIDLSVDDEINKSKLAIYQPLPKIQLDFANDDKARDQHLNLFSTVRGIAVLTLSYLDKTIAAGLATTQQQLDQNLTHMLLKQISWTSSKMANPNWEQLYNDTDEKFQYCMVTNGGENASQVPDALKHVRMSEGDKCPKECSEAPPGNTAIQGYYSKANLYHYCVCCAELDKAVNVAVDTSGGSGSGSYKSPAKDKGWSLVDRLFIGNKLPEAKAYSAPGGASTPGSPETIAAEDAQEKANRMLMFAAYWRALYGDIVILPPQENPAGGDLAALPGAAAQSEGTHRRYTIEPLFSVPEWITLFRNYEDLKEDEKYSWMVDGTCREVKVPEYYDQIQPEYCPITGEALKFGICPSLKKIVEIFDSKNLAPLKEDDNKRRWIEASLGGILTSENLVNLSKMGQNSARRARWIETFCDASAVTAYKKLHLRTMSITLDHIAMNTTLSKQHVEQAKALMNRVSSYLELGALDSTTAVRNMLIAQSVEADRIEEAERAATWSAAVAAQETSQKLGELLTFGGSLNLPSY